MRRKVKEENMNTPVNELEPTMRWRRVEEPAQLRITDPGGPHWYAYAKAGAWIIWRAEARRGRRRGVRTLWGYSLGSGGEIRAEVGLYGSLRWAKAAVLEAMRGASS